MRPLISEKRKLFLSIAYPEINFAGILAYKIHLFCKFFGGISERIEPMYQRPITLPMMRKVQPRNLILLGLWLTILREFSTSGYSCPS